MSQSNEIWDALEAHYTARFRGSQQDVHTLNIQDFSGIRHPFVPQYPHIDAYEPSRELNMEALEDHANIIEMGFVLAGRSLTRAIIRMEEDENEEKPMDVYFVGKTREQMRIMLQTLLGASGGIARHIYMVEMGYYRVHIQSYSTMSELLHDLPAGPYAMAYDGKLHFTGISLFAHMNNYIIVDPNLAHDLDGYAKALAECFQELQFSILLPNFVDEIAISPYIPGVAVPGKIDMVGFRMGGYHFTYRVFPPMQRPNPYPPFVIDERGMGLDLKAIKINTRDIFDEQGHTPVSVDKLYDRLANQWNPAGLTKLDDIIFLIGRDAVIDLIRNNVRSLIRLPFIDVSPSEVELQMKQILQQRFGPFLTYRLPDILSVIPDIPTTPQPHTDMVHTQKEVFEESYVP